jgi:hypothetical protein
MIGDMLLVAVACWGITYSIFGKFSLNWASNIIVRAALALASFVIIFHPNTNVSIVVAVIVVPGTFYGVIRHRRIAPPDRGLQSQPAGA